MLKNQIVPFLFIIALTLVACGSGEVGIPPTATPAPPATPAAREVYPEGEPGPAVIHEPGWTTPIKVPFNDDGWEDSPYITRDGQQIIFFYHPYPDLISAAEQMTEMVVYQPVKAVALGIDGKLYTSPRPFVSRYLHPISDNDSPALECCASLSLSGDLFYTSNRESFEQMADVPIAIFRNGERLFGLEGQNIDNPDYCEAKDELWFDCPGDANLCVMRDAAASDFQGAVELAPYPVNARDVEKIQDSQAFLTDDCNTLYITSSRDYPDLELIQIYRLQRLDEAGSEWSEPELFISNETPIAELSMTADGRELTFAQIFWREDGTPDIDIYYSRKIGE
jgi:hypothetical protein